MLHIVNKSPLDRNALDSALRMAKAGSTILLIEDGIYAVTKGNKPKARSGSHENRYCQRPVA